MVLLNGMLVLGLLVLTCTFVYEAIFVVAAVLSRNRSQGLPPAPNCQFAVLIPAHNEEDLLGRCLEAISSCQYPGHLRHVYVIADNCTDATGAIASSRSVTCWERHDVEKRGKGYAIEWALGRIDLNAYDAVLFLDADAVVSADIFSEIGKLLVKGEKAIQVYNGTLNANDNWLTRCSHLSDVFQFLLYFKGREVLGATSRLLGNGMCLHREVLERVPWSAYSITENWEYYFNVLLSGYRVAFTPHASANSDQVGTLKQAKSQKMRWQTGWTEVARKYVPQILGVGLKGRDVRVLDAAIDFLLPSAAIQAGIMLAAIIGALVLKHTLLVWWTLIVGFMGSAIAVMSLVVARAGLKDYIALFYAPFYVAWKILLRARLIGRIGAKDWVRTARKVKRLPG